MTDQGPLGRPPRGASVPGGAPRGAGPQLIIDVDMILARGGANCTRLQQTRGGLTIDRVKVITRCRRLLYTIARRAGGDSAGRQRSAAQGSSPMMR